MSYDPFLRTSRIHSYSAGKARGFFSGLLTGMLAISALWFFFEKYS